ncbi:ATP-binding protein [Archangium lansingense]|uniref:histidine kinase n=1 Tax=Archangium lansingense TaxID=2995310 RepID=A0ABT4AN71_9BACT|nr:ATP-binding protein [Archangium lansinium]MCY1082761.1 ATP-binding protein [Archangium lansinium]
MDIDVRRVLDSLGDPMLALDRSARVLHANAGLKELLGWSRLELLGRPVSKVLPGGLPELSWGNPPPPSMARQPFRTSALRRDGRPREVEVRLSPWPGGENEGLLIVSLRSLEAQVELERQLRLSQRVHVLDAALTQVFSSALDEEEAAYAVLRACGQLEGWVLGTYWRLERGDGVLVPLTVWAADGGLGDFVHVTLQSTFAPPTGLPGQAWARREPIWSQDVTQDVRFLRMEPAARHGLHGALFLPVLGGRHVQGVMELFSREPREDRAADMTLATTLGFHFGRFLDRLHHMEAEHTRLNGLRALWDSDLLGLFISDVHGRILEANPTLLRMLGYSREDVREEHLTWSLLTPPRERVVTESTLRRLRADGVFQSHEGTLLRKNDNGMPVLLGSANLGGGRVVTFALDLSDWKPTESTPPQETDARLHSLIAQAPVVLFALDRDGLLTLSEGHALESLGLKPGQSVGMSVFDLYRTEPTVLQAVRQALAGEEFFSKILLSNGLMYETHWVPLHDAEGQPAGTLGLALDVTQREHEARWRAQLFEEAEEARAEAERAVRLRDEFLSVASHELKTPLTSLSLQLHTLLKRAKQSERPEDAETAQRLEKAQRQSHKLARMMDELLDISRLAEGRLQLELSNVDLVQVVREVMERFQEEAQRTCTSLELRADEQIVGRWDRTKLEQVVTNLVSNALKYGAGAPVEVQVHSSGAMALLEVTDHGIGISPQDLGRIFGKFERAVPVRQYGGFGLGLYIVRQLVEALGGGVDAESTPGSGSTFHIVLPLAGPETRLPPPPAQADLH